MPELAEIVSYKLNLASLDPNQKIYFLLTGTLIESARYEEQLLSFFDKSWHRIQHISDFLGNRLSSFQMEINFTERTLSKLIEIQTPFSEVDWPKGGGAVSQAMSLGDHVRGLIEKLSAKGTTESLKEINRLLALPSLEKIKRQLLISKQEVIQKLRENSFDHFNLLAVSNILGNSNPNGPADLQALVLDFLDQIAQEIKTSNGDLYRQFWTEGKDNQHKTEPSCRDALLEMLRTHLSPRSIDCQPEVDHFNDKRADIRVTYRNQFAVPIEIKGEWHRELWTAVNNQFIPQYTDTKESKGYGIYLVLWVGGFEQSSTRDGGKKPVTPSELESRFNKQLPQESQKRIAVRVIDISWPPKTSKG